MNRESNTPNEPFMKAPLQYGKAFLKRKVNHCNEGFNALSMKEKKTSVMAFGISIATMCTILILKALFGPPNTSLSIHKITLPDDIYRNAPDTQKLIPIGKLKGERNGDFESFYIAVDREGQLFINHDEFTPDSLNKSKGWEPMARQQLESFEKQLHFIPTPRKD